MACEFSRRGGVVKLQKKTVSASATGKVNVTPDAGYTALSDVEVNQIQLQSKSLLPSSLPYTFSPDATYVGLKNAVVQKDPNLISDNIIAGKSIFGVSGEAVVPKIYGKGYQAYGNSVKGTTQTFFADANNTPFIYSYKGDITFRYISVILNVGMPGSEGINFFGATGLYELKYPSKILTIPQVMICYGTNIGIAYNVSVEFKSSGDIQITFNGFTHYFVGGGLYDAFFYYSLE